MATVERALELADEYERQANRHALIATAPFANKDSIFEYEDDKAGLTPPAICHNLSCYLGLEIRVGDMSGNQQAHREVAWSRE